ncbi:MAG: Re/Si-specific NAD(P)(+) transhydrogenase subunit alpha [Streptosporangiaceae bacterium]
MKVAVIKETAPGESRAALVPETVAKLTAAGLDVLIESGAGDRAWHSDDSYREAGAQIVSRSQALADAEAVLAVGKPDDTVIAGLRKGQVLLSMLAPLTDPGLVRQLAQTGVTAVSLDLIPRTLPRAQQMDALSSQANIAGYKAVLVAAAAYGRFFPLLITAAGTARPAKVLVLGAGVAGLQAIGTAKRLGAVVSGYDVRPETKTEVASLGGTFIELKAVGPASGTGGYARALTDAERDAQQAELAGHIAQQDVIITTAQVPGRRPPVLVTEQALAQMKPGSVIIDMGASELGGNVAGSQPGETVVTPNGITIIGAGNLPSSMAPASSAMYARNISALLQYMIKDGAIAIDTSDELLAGVVITRDGQVVHPALAEPAASAVPAEAEPELADSAGGSARVDGPSH